MAKQTNKQKLATLVVGNVGMYFAAYQLSLRGWNVMRRAMSEFEGKAENICSD